MEGELDIYQVAIFAVRVEYSLEIHHVHSIVETFRYLDAFGKKIQSYQE